MEVVVPPITAELSLFAEKRCPPVPRHTMQALLSHLFSFQPWNTLEQDKKGRGKMLCLVPAMSRSKGSRAGRHAGHLGWERAGGREEQSSLRRPRLTRAY